MKTNYEFDTNPQLSEAPQTITEEVVTPAVVEKFHKPLHPFTCEAKDFDIICQGTKKRAHIITRQAQEIKGDALNIINICEAHERYFNQKPLKYWYRFVKEYHPTNFRYLVQKAQFIHDQVLDYLEVADE